MLELTIQLPTPLSQQVEASGLSHQQLGKAITYLLEIYLKVEQSKDLVEISQINEVQQNFQQTESAPYNGTSYTRQISKQRKLGAGKWKGHIWMADDFDELPEDVLNLFTGEGENNEPFA